MNGTAGGGGGGDTRHVVNQGDAVVLRDNRNESSNDTNPYAYPYYHHPSSSEEGPRLYDMVVRLGGKWLGRGFEEEEELEVDVAQILARLDQSHPREILWKDSCGDTALHRLCQTARFLDVFVVSELQMGSSSLVAVAKAIVECNPKAAVALNNWKETPLHQFVAHCSFPTQPPNDRLRQATTLYDRDVRIRLQMIRNPWISLLKCLCSNEFGTASVPALSAPNCANHWGALPLHDACTLSGVVVDRDEYQGGRRNPLYGWLHEQHLQMVQILYQRAGSPDHLIRKDQQGLTPLHRAFDSNDCESQAFEYLLGEALNQPYGISTLLEQLFQKTFTSGRLEHFRNRRRTNSENKFEPLWSKFLLLVPKHHEAVLAEQQHYHDRTRDDTWTFLHKFVHLWCKATSSGRTPPREQPHLLQFVVEAHPEQLVRRDAAGRTPLMVFLMENEQEGKSSSSSHEEQLRLLVDSSKRVLGTPLLHSGRYPLHVAISRGIALSWCCSSYLAKQDRRIATLRDPVTGFYPFQLAAAASTPFTNINNRTSLSLLSDLDEYFEEDKDDTWRLGLIFELLREAPVACASATTSTRSSD